MAQKMDVNICFSCKGKENRKWIEVSPGHQRLVYLCCLEKETGKPTTFYLHRFKDVSAQFVDKKTGEEYWVDKKGRKVSPEDVRYKVYEQRDRFGWKATDKVPPQRTYHI